MAFFKKTFFAVLWESLPFQPFANANLAERNRASDLSHHPCMNGQAHKQRAQMYPEISGDEALQGVRTAIRLADYDSAQWLLEVVAEHPDQMTAEYFNLLGMLYESRREWTKAWHCLRQSIAMDPQTKPAKANMRRLLDLRTDGCTMQPALLGDEPEHMWYAQAVH